MSCSKFSHYSLVDKVKDEGDLVTFLNPYSYLIARDNWDKFSRFDRIAIDGIFLVIFLRLFLRIKVSRQSFDSTSVAGDVFSRAEISGASIYLVGTTEENINSAVKIIKNTFPRVNVVGWRDGYFECDESRQIFLCELAGVNPGVVVCGMGALRQEEFLLDLQEAGWKGKGYTCGGYFHQLAEGGYQYYPEWIDRLQLRWLYRMYKEPEVRRRYIVDYPKFVIKFIGDFLWAR